MLLLLCSPSIEAVLQEVKQRLLHHICHLRGQICRGGVQLRIERETAEKNGFRFVASKKNQTNLFFFFCFYVFTK